MKELTAGSFLLNKLLFEEKNEAAEAAARVPSATGTLDLQRTNSFPPIRSVFHAHSASCEGVQVLRRQVDHAEY